MSRSRTMRKAVVRVGIVFQNLIPCGLRSTPASVTKDHNDLDVSEMERFVKHIELTLDDAAALAVGHRPAPIAV